MHRETLDIRLSDTVRCCCTFRFNSFQFILFYLVSLCCVCVVGIRKRTSSENVRFASRESWMPSISSFIFVKYITWWWCCPLLQKRNGYGKTKEQENKIYYLNITTAFDNYILSSAWIMLVWSTLSIWASSQMLWYIATNQISFACKWIQNMYHNHWNHCY